ncbi:MAG: hypothetical protein ACRDLB_11425 [Actinomycetota bacterium]
MRPITISIARSFQLIPGRATQRASSRARANEREMLLQQPRRFYLSIRRPKGLRQISR